MGDNDKLLKIVLNLHYHDNPKVVGDAMKIIENYCANDQTNSAYEEVLKTIHNVMNDLPSNILLYFLTTVPLPKHEDEASSTFSELMNKSRVTLLDNMQAVLTEYINTTVPSFISIDNGNEEENGKVEETQISSKRKTPNEDFDQNMSESEPSFKKNKFSFVIDKSNSCLKLVEICAEYVVLNGSELLKYYNEKNKIVWGVVNQNICNCQEQAQCYKHIEDINRKLKLLRMIEAGHISAEVIEELYGNSEIFLKERNLYKIIDEGVFKASKELEEAIEDFVNS